MQHTIEQLKNMSTQELIGVISSQPKNLTIRDARHHKIGDVCHQGDIYLTKVSPDHPRGVLDETTRQLAPGNTKGSRHIVSAKSNVRIYQGVQFPPGTKEEFMQYDTCLGPLVEVVGDDALIEHPEHASYLVAGTYQVTYQLDERTKQRTTD